MISHKGVQPQEEMDLGNDVEKYTVEVKAEKPPGHLRSLVSRLENHGGIEVKGAEPVPFEDRTVTRYWHVFSLWFCMSCNMLP